jgi:hypothetical protein
MTIRGRRASRPKVDSCGLPSYQPPQPETMMSWVTLV